MATDDGGLDTKASITFIKPGSWPPTEKPFELLYVPTDGFPVSNFKLERVHDIEVHDMRPYMNSLSLDQQGFIVAPLASALRYENFWDEKSLTDVYAEELRNFLLSSLHARSVFIHECVLRKRSQDPNLRNTGYGQPVSIAHTDYTIDYVHKLVRQLTQGKAPLISNRRFQMLNIWKPLRGPLRDWPIAVCDLRSLKAEHFVEVDEVHSHQSLESQQILYSSAQNWFYLSNQHEDEILIFKAADSEVAGEVPHAAFEDPRCPKNEAPRESIEFRVLVVY